MPSLRVFTPPPVLAPSGARKSAIEHLEAAERRLQWAVEELREEEDGYAAAIRLSLVRERLQVERVALAGGRVGEAILAKLPAQPVDTPPAGRLWISAALGASVLAAVLTAPKSLAVLIGTAFLATPKAVILRSLAWASKKTGATTRAT